MADNNLNLLNFKFGPQARLPQDKAAGTVYITTDEQAMYIDLPNEDGILGRLKIGDIAVVQSAKAAQPPFSIGFYYFVEDNAFLRWDGSNWTQINTVSDIQGSITDLEKAFNEEKARSKEKDESHDNSIQALQEALASRVTTQDFESFKTTNTEAIADAKKAGTDAATAAAAADKKAGDAATAANNAMVEAGNKLPLSGGNMTGAIDMGTYKITSLGTPQADTDAATKKYVDDAKSNALTAAGEALEAAGAAQDKADSAHSLASTANSTANSASSKAIEAYELAETKVTMAQVEDKNYATKTEAQGYVDVLKGAEGDSKDTVSVYGAIAAAQTAKAAADDAQRTANSKTTMADVEAKNYATKTEAQAMADVVLGNSENDADDYTVYGAHKAAAAAKEQADKGVSDAAKAAATAGDAQSTANNALTAAGEADTKASTAQTTANEAKKAAANADANAETRLKITDFESFQETNTAAIDIAKKAGTDAQKTANDALAAAGEADTKAQEAKDAAAEADRKAVAANNNAETRLLIADFNSFKETNNSNIAEAKKAGTDAQNTANTALEVAGNALPKAGGTMSGSINMGGSAITNVAVPTNDTDAANKTYVDTAIADGIKANDAMTFKGTLGGTGATISTLPETAQKGDTYKVAQKGDYGEVNAKVGDLFINTANDDAPATWVHISSGYEDDYLQKFVQDNNVIHLTDGVSNTSAGSVSSFTIVGSENSNLQFNVTSNGNDLTVTGSMIWGEF